MSQMTSSFGVSQMPGFVASQKDYQKAKTRTRLLIILVSYYENTDVSVYRISTIDP